MPSYVRGRYAPSPTGELHLGNLRTALVAWLAVRSSRGTFILRVEDLDQPRVIEGAEERILDDLRWLGLDWDEGPDVGGAHGPYRQSERMDFFAAALQKLENRLYPCTCSRSDLRRLASAPHGPQEEGPAYPGFCREKQRHTERPPRPAALRFSVAPGDVFFSDLMMGEIQQNVAQDVGDFVLRRADQIIAYQLAVVVDDGAMNINQVVRGADLLDSTPRQIQLFQALDLPIPRFAHIPLVLNADGERLAKRDQSTNIRALRHAGIQADELLGILGHSLGLRDTPGACTLGHLVDAFAWEKLSRKPWVCSGVLKKIMD